MPNLIFFVNKMNRCTSFNHNKVLDADQFFLSGRLSTSLNLVVMDFVSDFYYFVVGFMISVASATDQIVYSGGFILFYISFNAAHYNMENVFRDELRLWKIARIMSKTITLKQLFIVLYISG